MQTGTGLRIAKTILITKNKLGRINSPYTKPYYVAIAVKTVWNWHRHRHTYQWNITENLKVDSKLCPTSFGQNCKSNSSEKG